MLEIKLINFFEYSKNIRKFDPCKKIDPRKIFDSRKKTDISKKI